LATEKVAEAIMAGINTLTKAEILFSSSSSSSSSVCVGVAALQVEKGGLREDRLEKK